MPVSKTTSIEAPGIRYTGASPEFSALLPGPICVANAALGTYQGQSADAERLKAAVILMSNVFPDAKIQLMNLSEKPDSSWERTADVHELACDTKSLPSAECGLVLTEAELTELNIKAGHVLALRQVTDYGVASEETIVALGRGTAPTVASDSRWSIGTNQRISGSEASEPVRKALGLGENDFVKFWRAPDESLPICAMPNLRIDASSEEPALTGRYAAEVGAEFSVTNLTLQEQGSRDYTYVAKVQRDRSVRVVLDGVEDGHRLKLWLVDHSGLRRLVGEIIYHGQPSVAAGPMAEQQANELFRAKQ